MGPVDLRAGEIIPTWRVEWEKAGEAAKKEGQVTVYVHSTYAPALESGAFQKAFPEIKLVTVSGVELQLERRFTADGGQGNTWRMFSWSAFFAAMISTRPNCSSRSSRR
jgi:hypothetical protein